MDKDKTESFFKHNNLELTPVKMYGSKRMVGFYGDFISDRNDLSGKLVDVVISEPRDMFAQDTEAPPIMMKEDAVQKMFQDLWNMG